MGNLTKEINTLICRLEAIRIFICLEDMEEIPNQIKKLRLLKLNPEIKNIIILLEKKYFGLAASAIEMAINKHQSVINKGEFFKPKYIKDVTKLDKLIPICKNEKWGFVTKQKKTAIDFIYDDASDFSEGLACVKKNNRYGYINMKGELAIPFQFDYGYGFSDSFALVNLNHKLGYINTFGDIEIPYQFDGALEFKNGLASVEKNKQWALINKKGKVLYDYNPKYISAEYKIDDLYEIFQEEGYDRVSIGFLTLNGAKYFETKL